MKNKFHFNFKISKYKLYYYKPQFQTSNIHSMPMVLRYPVSACWLYTPRNQGKNRKIHDQSLLIVQLTQELYYNFIQSIIRTYSYKYYLNIMY